MNGRRFVYKYNILLLIDTCRFWSLDLTWREINRRKFEYTDCFEDIRRKNVTIASFVEFLESLLFLFPLESRSFPSGDTLWGDESGDEGDESLVKQRIDELISIELPSLDTGNNCHCTNNSTGYIPIVTRFDCCSTNEICMLKKKKKRERRRIGIEAWVDSAEKGTGSKGMCKPPL